MNADTEITDSLLASQLTNKLTLLEMAQNFELLHKTMGAKTLEEVATITGRDVRFVRRVLSIARPK